MEGEAATVGEAIGNATDAAREAASLAEANAAATVAVIAEAAQARVEAAEQTAEQIMQAAIETRLGERISECDRRISEWLDGEGRALRQEVDRLTAELAEVRTQLAATATVAVVAATSEQSLSIPEKSAETLTETTAEVASVIPEALQPVVTNQNENTLAAPNRRRLKVFR